MELDKILANPSPPKVRDFEDYRSFLESFYNYKKATRSGFSYRQFATLVGLKSPNYIQLVIQGKRNLTETTALRLAEKIKLSSKEADYFASMVRLENAANDQEKLRFEREKFSAFKKLVTTDVGENQLIVLSEWWHLLVRELIALKEFEADGKWISERLRGVISPEQAEKSLQVLEKSEFVEVSDGKWRLKDPVLDTGLENFPHSKMQEVHSEILKAWSRNLKNLSPLEQELGVLNIPMKRSSIPKLKEKILKFQDEVIGWLENETSNGADEIVQLGTYLFSFSEWKTERR